MNLECVHKLLSSEMREIFEQISTRSPKQYHIARARCPVDIGAVALSESAAAPRGDDMEEARGTKNAKKIACVFEMSFKTLS